MKRKILVTIILFTILLNCFSTIIMAANNNVANNKTTNETNQVDNTTKNQNTTSQNKIENNVENKATNTTEEKSENTLENNTDKKNENKVENKTEVKNETKSENKIENNTNNTEKENKKENQKENKVENQINKADETEKIDMSDGIDTQALQQGKAVESNGVQYRTHVQYDGWQNWKNNGDVSGTSGRSLRLEGINIKLTGDIASKVKIKYQVHVQYDGWQNWKSNGEMAGTEGRSLRLEAIRIKLEDTEDYSVMYRVHVQYDGWQDWKKDGEMAGTSGRSLRLEAIQIKIVPKIKVALINLDTAYNGSVYYSPSTINVSGWKMANVSNTKMKVYIDNSRTPIDDAQITYKKRDDVISAIQGYGTSKENEKPGFSFNINGSNMQSGTHTIKIVVYSKNDEKIQELESKIKIDRDLHVQYNAHVQYDGWQSWKNDGEMSGTSGRSLRIEALNIKLINAPANAGIIYRAHVQYDGWQAWKSNGQMAGTSGRSLRVEALEIKLQNMSNYTVEYQVHIQDYGWSGWYIDGETAGTVGQGKRIEAIRIRIVPKYKRNYRGIDVSEFNHSINWALVKRSGVEFAMIRVGYRGYGTEGNFKEDANFRINIESAKKAGVPVGIYFVTQATNRNEAIEEANWVINKLKGYSIDYPVAIDIERSAKPNGLGRADGLDKNTRTYLAKTFCEIIQSSGYTPLVYTNVDWATNKLDMSQLSAYDTWIASYKQNIQSGPSYNGKYAIWQHTSSGKIDGILGNVDLNICYKKY